MIVYQASETVRLNDKPKHSAFTLIELLVTVAVLSLLMALLVPALQNARLQARIAMVNTELFQIGQALEAYGLENRDKFPPTYVSCMLQEHYYQLPDELINNGYLPDQSDTYSPMSCKYEDRFNLGHTYKYLAPGDLVLNQFRRVQRNLSRIWVPQGFPELDTTNGEFYCNPADCPVSWAIFSIGPDFNKDDPNVVNQRYPVPRQTWYDTKTKKGFLIRIRIKNGEHVGTFGGKK